MPALLLSLVQMGGHATDGVIAMTNCSSFVLLILAQLGFFLVFNTPPKFLAKQDLVNATDARIIGY